MFLKIDNQFLNTLFLKLPKIAADELGDEKIRAFGHWLGCPSAEWLGGVYLSMYVVRSPYAKVLHDVYFFASKKRDLKFNLSIQKVHLAFLCEVFGIGAQDNWDGYASEILALFKDIKDGKTSLSISVREWRDHPKQHKWGNDLREIYNFRKTLGQGGRKPVEGARSKTLQQYLNEQQEKGIQA